MLKQHKNWQFECASQDPLKAGLVGTGPILKPTSNTDSMIDNYIGNVRQGKGRIMPAIKPQPAIYHSPNDRRFLANRQTDTIQERLEGKPPENLAERQAANREYHRNYQKNYSLPSRITATEQKLQKLREMQKMLIEK